MKTESKTGDETMKAESTTGDETAKTQKQVVIYLLADDHIEVEVQPLTMGDLCEIVGTDRRWRILSNRCRWQACSLKRRGGVSSLF